MTDTTFRPSGPVSAALDAELRTQARKHGLVVWLDPLEHYSKFIDEMSAAPSGASPAYELCSFRGSYLELMQALEPLTGGVEPRRVVVHLPGLNENTVKNTPMYEVYRAGKRYRKALTTLVTEAAAGKVRPDEIDAFASKADLTLVDADAWLGAVVNDEKGGLALQLRALTPKALLDDLLSGGFVASRLDPAAEKLLWDHLEVAIGLPTDWRTQSWAAGAVRTRPDDIAHDVASWALSVEYVVDLRREPVSPRLKGIRKLPKAVQEACCELTEHLRQRHPEIYRRTADDTENLLDEERSAAKAEDLGDIDTFRFEEKEVLEAALAALAAKDWSTAAQYARVRIGGESFWIRNELPRWSAWQLVAAAAELGQAVVEAGPKLAALDHVSALSRYVEHGAKVDGAHRRLEQLRAKLSPELPLFESLRQRLDEAREFWRDWANTWATDFNDLCTRVGFLPPAELQQRYIFDDVVQPETQQGATAFFVVDALRFEMAQALAEALQNATTGTAISKVALSARLAELPSTSGVGMNVLAPVQRRGRLTPVVSKNGIRGFSTGEFQVVNPATRQRSMRDRVGGDTCPWLTLAEVLDRDAASLKKAVSKAKLIVVHSLEIDSAGHKGAGLDVFDNVLHQLRSAWRLLHKAGVKRFVFTADHGFLLLDGIKPQRHGRPIDPRYRYVLSPVGVTHPGEVRVALSDLGYQGVSDHVMFPVTVAPFDRGGRPETFAHGGNSLQERVVPVLTVVHRTTPGQSTLKYQVVCKGLEDVAGFHCLTGRVELIAQQSLEFVGAKSVELALRVVDVPDVSVELGQTRGGATLVDGVLSAEVGEDFELFFRLSGRSDARALVALYHPSGAVDVKEAGPTQRFAIAVASPGSDTHEPAKTEASKKQSVPPGSWLTQLPEGVREVFAHIEAHGVCVEDEAAKMLGGARQLRRFSSKFEAYAAVAPFGARIEVVGGVKRYVKEGT